MKKQDKTMYVCNNCGNESLTWAGRCTSCGEWNTLKEFKVPAVEKRADGRTSEVKKLDEISLSDTTRIATGMSELDRVLGGGIVPGSLILIGGEPGIGKSTLLLQVAQNIKNTFYLSGEESLAQIKSRADRLKITNDQLRLIATTAISDLRDVSDKYSPGLIIVDSIQTVFSDTNPSSPGSVGQVKECGLYLQKIAKEKNIPIIIVGHVTKEGDIAGPRVLEHLVDVVLYFEGDRFLENRIIRSVKNRFGSTNEVGIFSLGEKGMEEIANPSKLLINESVPNPGSALTVTMEGKRPLMVEIQALVIKTNFGYPKRTSSGFDLNRLNLLAGVISKKTRLDLSSFDIYLNVIGGIKIMEPSVDLSVCAAILSSFKEIALPEKSCFFGEVGLSGEVRRVNRQEERIKEAKRLGYEPVLNIKNIAELLRFLTKRQA